MRQLSIQSRHSISSIRRMIQYWLLRPPCDTRDLSPHRYLIFDGTILEHRRGIFSSMDAEKFSVLHGARDISEGPSDLQRFCVALAQRGLVAKSATVDGNQHLIKTLHTFWPFIIIQRCLVHIQRQGLMWCRRNPNRCQALAKTIPPSDVYLHSRPPRSFLTRVQEWEQKYGRRIASSPETGWVFSDLKRARSMLLSALPDMFHYPNDPNVPKSTAALEGYYAHLKQKYRQHRGLVKRHRD